MIVDKSKWPCGLFQLRLKAAQLIAVDLDYIARKAAKQTAIEQDYIDWAVKMLVHGYDTPSLIDLAGLDLEGQPVDSYDAKKLFDKSLEELNIPPTTDEEILRLWLAHRAKQIKDGQIDPVEAVALIHDEVINPLEHPNDLMEWCRARSGFLSVGPDDMVIQYSEQEWPEVIRAFAEPWAINESLLDDNG